jgi:hypothetical protein
VDIQQRGIAASRAYLERTGVELLEGELPAGIDILGIDGSTLVGVLVSVRRESRAKERISETTKDASLTELVAHRDRAHPECAHVRLDVISILIIAENRALLRHYREERSG